jgi:hypothetical protein
VPNFAKVKDQSVYPGIDLVYYGNHQQLEYDFVVAPGARPSAIKLAIGAMANVGASAAADTNRPAQLAIDSDGDLVVRVAGSEIRFHRPVVYQEITNSNLGSSPVPNRKYLHGNYVLTAHNQIGFRVGAYDKTKPLIIDPVLTYSSLIGGDGIDDGLAITVDASGNAYLTGVSNSPNFPLVNQIPGACNGTCPNGGNGVVYLTKINAAGSALVYSSYLGGSGDDNGGSFVCNSSIAVDDTHNAYLSGCTRSADFPRVPESIPGGCNGSCGTGASIDAFVIKISP